MKLHSLKRYSYTPMLGLVFLIPTQLHAGSIGSNQVQFPISCDTRVDPRIYMQRNSCSASERSRILDSCYFVISQQDSGNCSWQSCKGISIVGKLPTYNSVNKTVIEYGVASPVSAPPAPVNTGGTVRPINHATWPHAYLTVREALCLRKHFCNSPARGNYDAFRSRMCAEESDKFPLNPYLGCASITEPDCSSLAATLSPTGVLPSPAPLTAEVLVEQAYRGVLLGGSDSGGKQYWINQIKNNHTCIGSAAWFGHDVVASDRINVGIDPNDIITGWYRGHLNREPDIGGLNYWVSVYNAQPDKLSVKRDFLETPEFRKRCDEVCKPQTFSLNSSLTVGLNYFSSSCNRKHTLRFESGGLVIRNPDGTQAWSTGNKGATRAEFQADGNLVLYNSNRVAVWASNTNGNSASRLVFREGGRLSVERADGSEVSVIFEGSGRF